MNRFPSETVGQPGSFSAARHSQVTVSEAAGLVFGYTFVFLMLVLPTAYAAVRAVTLAIVLIIVGMRMILSRRLGIHRAILCWTLLLVSVSAVFMLRGLVDGQPGAVRVGTVYVLWPLVYLVLISGLSNKFVIDGMFKVLAAATIAISLYTLSFLLRAVGWFPDYLYLDLKLGQVVGIYGGFVEFNLYSISSLIFLVPFFTTCLLIWPKHNMPVARVWIWCACFLGIGVSILSGRRALWLVVAISPIVVLLGRCLMHRSYHMDHGGSFYRRCITLFLLGILLISGLQSLIGLDLSALYSNFIAGFDFFKFEDGDSERIRSTQFSLLLDAWQRNPIFGVGHGAGLPGLVRSEEMPWAFELSYLALAYHTGIVGFFLYTLGIVWVFVLATAMMRSGHWLGLYVFPTMVGTISFLIANATNPYLGKFDYLWVIFLPVGLINYWLLENRDERAALQQNSGEGRLEGPLPNKVP